MDAIINFFKSIGHVITSCIELVWTFIEDIIQIVLMLSKFLGQLPEFFSWVPDSVQFMLFSIFSIVVLYKISGREG